MKLRVRLSGWLGLGGLGGAAVLRLQTYGVASRSRPATEQDRLRRVPALQKLAELLE